MMNRAFLVVLLVVFQGCTGPIGQVAEQAGRAMGVLDQPAPGVVTIDILCDTTLGSSCTPATLAEAVAVGLSRVSESLGSSLRLWRLSDDVATVAIMCEVTYSGSSSPGARAHRAARDAFLNRARAELSRAAEELCAKPGPRRSVIAEAITKIGYATSKGEHTIILVTDGKEESSFGRFECETLPSDRDFLKRLHDARVLTPGSLEGTSVIFSHAGLQPTERNRCAATIDRWIAMKNLWVAAITSASATITYYTENMPVDALTHEIGVIR